jgi:hypothetical protein
MKTKTIFKSALVVLLLGASVSTMAEYVKDPTLCNGVGTTWDATTRKFTVIGLHGNIQEPWIAYLTDASWCSTCYVDICPYGTYIPGSSTFTSSTLGTSYGDPLKNGANGSSALFIALKAINNDLPKGAKSEDCNVTSQDNVCCGPCMRPTYCENYNATFSGSIINVRAINNDLPKGAKSEDCNVTLEKSCNGCTPNPNTQPIEGIWYKILTSGGFTGKTDTVHSDVAYRLDRIPQTDSITWGGSKYSISSTLNDSNYVIKGQQGRFNLELMSYYADMQNGKMVVTKGDFLYKRMDTPDGEEVLYSRNKNALSLGNQSVDIAPVSVFPNPAAVGQAVNVKGSFDADSRVAIYDATASLIATVVPTITSDGLTFEVPAQATAINFIKIISAKDTFSAKLSVVK